MKKKYRLFFGCELVFPMLLILSTACNPSTVGDTLTGGTSDSKEYVITQNGDINYPKDSTLAVEYYTFLIDNYYNSRALYFGGLVPSGYDPNELVVSIECTGLQYSSYDDNYIKSYQLNSKDYYYVPIIVQSDKNPGNYTITARLHKQGFNAIIAKTYTLKVAQYLSQGNWGLNVYQQESYNRLDIAKDDLIDSFSKMGVYFGDNNINIVNVNSSLPDQVVNYDNSGIPANDDLLLQYVFGLVCPGVTPVTAAMDKFWNDYPNTGLLFFIKDYNPIGSTPNDLSGVTYSQYFENGVAKKAPISVIFAEKCTNINQPRKNRYISYNVIHELGHLWCHGFIDDTHSFWHNSDNKNICSMLYDLHFLNGDPDPYYPNTEKVLILRRFCTGHLQRGSNVSWQLRQYTPFGEGTTSPNKILLASKINTENSLNDNLKIELVCDKTDFIQGESIDILIKIINNKPDTIIVKPQYYLNDLNSDSTFKHYGGGVFILPPYGTCYYMLDPADGLLFFGRMDFTTHSLVPGNYTFFSSVENDNQKYLSNKINIEIDPVPDSLVQAFNDLKRYPNEVQTIENAKNNLEKYKGTFYEKKYYVPLIYNGNYQNAVQNKTGFGNYRDEALRLLKEFIIKFPSSSIAAGLFRVIMYNFADNQALVEEILTLLKNNQPDCKLLEVLRNQPDDLYKQISHLLY